MFEIKHFKNGKKKRNKVKFLNKNKKSNLNFKFSVNL